MNDLINRQDAIKCIRWGEGITDTIERIKALPSAEAKTKCIAQIEVDTEELVRRIKEEYDITDGWIPCSERLPEEETDVLICNANGDIEISRGSYSTEVEDDFFWYTSGWRFGEVVAWMPLPEPYKEEDR